MNKTLRAEIDSRIRGAYSLGVGNHELFGTDIRSAEFAAYGAGLEVRIGAQEELIRKLVRWHDATSRIGWCHFTFNPWVGCVKVSSGCKHCYAEGWAKRAGRKVWGRKAERPVTKSWEAKLRRWRLMAADPMWRQEFGLREGERPRIFVGSLCDWAENRDDVQRLAIMNLFDLIRDNDWADWLLLTKRPQNVSGMLPADWGEGWRHVWLGVSVESGEPDVIDAELRAPVIERARLLLRIPAAIHWLSYEPAIGPLAFAIPPFLEDGFCACGCSDMHHEHVSTTGGMMDRGACFNCDACDAFSENGFDWVVYGGESGPRFRAEGAPEDPKLWAREMRDACAETGTAFFHKQSAHRFNERGQELDGELIQEYPTSMIGEPRKLFKETHGPPQLRPVRRIGKSTSHEAAH